MSAHAYRQDAFAKFHTGKWDQLTPASAALAEEVQGSRPPRHSQDDLWDSSKSEEFWRVEGGWVGAAINTTFAKLCCQ